MLPYGVRTFLQRTLRFTSDHLPSAENLAQWKPKKREPRITRMSRIRREGEVYELNPFYPRHQRLIASAKFLTESLPIL
jgi:hypothetical protein